MAQEFATHRECHGCHKHDLNPLLHAGEHSFVFYNKTLFEQEGFRRTCKFRVNETLNYSQKKEGSFKKLPSPF
jgi:hypothetical protein